jgi:hypothetical protein
LANLIQDGEANQVTIRIVASGADVTLGDNSLWYHDPEDNIWTRFVRSWEPGLETADGWGDSDLLRFPVGADAIHLQSVGATSLNNAIGTAQTIRDGA